MTMLPYDDEINATFSSKVKGDDNLSFDKVS